MNTLNRQEFKDHAFEGKNIIIGPDDIFLRCKFSDCHITLNMHRGNPGIYDAQLQNCLIEAKRKMMHGRFFGSNYVGCRFKGKFLGFDFGRSPWPNPIGNLDQFGELIDCDFTEATLDLCRFFQVDIGCQRFAVWPQFVIPFDRDLAASQRVQIWPGKFARYLGLMKDEDPALSASTGTCADFQKRYEITEEELVQALDDIGGVLR